IDPTLMRRSHSNQNWPLYIKPYKEWTFNFAPMDNTAAYDSSSIPSFDSVRYAIALSGSCLAMPRIYVPGTTTQDALAIKQLSCLGKPDKVGPLSMVKESFALWGASLVMGEQPP